MMTFINFWKKKDGFTLIETIVSTVLVSLLISATVVIFKDQAIFTHQIEGASEMQDNLRVASYWLTKDIREAVEIVSLGKDEDGDGKGPGPGINNAFKIKIKIKEEEKETEKTISYFYGSASKPNVFYRNDGGDQPLTNEYLFGGVSKGYVGGWSIKYLYFDEVDQEFKVTDDKDKVRLIEFTLYGSYGDKPDNFKPITSSAYIRRSLATP